MAVAALILWADAAQHQSQPKDRATAVPLQRDWVGEDPADPRRAGTDRQVGGFRLVDIEHYPAPAECGRHSLAQVGFLLGQHRLRCGRER